MQRSRKSLAVTLSAMFMSGGLMLAPAMGAPPRNDPGAPTDRKTTDGGAPAGHDFGSDPKPTKTTEATGRDAAAPAAGANAASGQQVDQQINAQLQKIQQQKDNLAGDRLFVLHNSCGNQFEIALGQLALQKSQDENVKKLAQHIVQDHTQANQKLMPIAQKLQVDPPQGLPSHKQQELQILGGMDSKAFDQAYVSMMDENHAKDVTCFRNKTATAQSPDVKQYASETLPKLQQHWEMTKQSATALGLPSGNEAQPASGRIPAAGHSDSGTSGHAPAGSTPGAGPASGTNGTGTGAPSGNR